MMGRMNRRTFIGMSASAFGIATTSRVVPAGSFEPHAIDLQEPITVMRIHDCNMAGFDWRWEFRLKRLPNGQCSVSAIQFDCFDEEEPWQLSPKQLLLRGREVLQALHDMATEASCRLDQDLLENAAENLTAIDPKLGKEFRIEVNEYFSEWG